MTPNADSVRTYEVSVQAVALRTIKVRARGGREAMEIAANRISYRSGPWTIDFPGGEDEHYSVELDGSYIGPDAQGGFDDDIDLPQIDGSEA